METLIIVCPQHEQGTVGGHLVYTHRVLRGVGVGGVCRKHSN